VEGAAVCLGAVSPLGGGEADGFVEDLADVDQLGGPLVLLAGEGEKSLDGVCALDGGLGGGFEEGAGLGVGGRGGLGVQVAEGKLDVAGDDGEGLVEVVSDAAGHLAEGAKLLTLLEQLALALGGTALGEIGEDGDAAEEGAVNIVEGPGADGGGDGGAVMVAAFELTGDGWDGGALAPGGFVGGEIVRRGERSANRLPMMVCAGQPKRCSAPRFQ
jgi:hypothetical protein